MIQRNISFMFYGKLFAIFALVFALMAQRSNSQGFDWQYSSRLPSAYPRLFFGGSVNGIYGFHTADIYSLGEEYRCGDYKKGVETGVSASGAGEYWSSGSIAFWGLIGFRTSTVRFTSETRAEPFRRNGEEFELRREFAMDVYHRALMIETGVKYRIARTHAHLGVGIRTDIVFSTSAEQTETILTPIEFTQSILDPNGIQPLPEMRKFLLTPIIAAGYDAELGKGIYATPRITVGFPIMSRSSRIDWTSIDLSGGISFFLSL